MNIDEMKPEEKSVLLTEVSGAAWKFENHAGNLLIVDFNGFVLGYGTLYDPDNMALAWRALNWAVNQPFNKVLRFDLSDYVDGQWIWDRSPADAQHFWLDQILTLAIDAGLVEVE